MKFDLKILVCVLSVDFYKQEKYVLSINQDKIDFPILELQNLYGIDTQIKNLIKEFFVDKNIVSDYVEHITFLGFNNEVIDQLLDTSNSLYLLFGVTVPHSKLNDNIFWHKFDFMDSNIANELTIIGATIENSI